MSWSVDPMHTQVEFSARHMGIMTVRGAFIGLTAATDFNEDDFTASSVEASIDTRTLSARDERRDAHLKSPATCIAGNMHAGFSAYTTINRKEWGLTWNVGSRDPWSAGRRPDQDCEAVLIKPAAVAVV